MENNKLWINSKNAKIATAYQAVIDSIDNRDMTGEIEEAFQNYVSLLEQQENQEELTMEKVADSMVGKELEVRYSNLTRLFNAYKTFHDDVLDILIHSAVILKEPRYTDREAIVKILDRIENV